MGVPSGVGHRMIGLAAVVLAPLAVLLGLASPAAADTTLEVTTPAEGRYQPGSVTPLLVTVGADRAVTGTLQASFDGVRSGAQRVEVPGGSTKQVVLLVATPVFNSPGQLTFTTDGGRGDRTVRLNLTPAGADELVAVLPSLAQSRQVPATAKLAVDVGAARLFRFDPGLLAAGGDVLSPFSQILATPADLAQLSAEQLDSVRAWLALGGGTLAIDAEAGTGLPAPLNPAGAAISTAADDPSGLAVGVGRVRWTRGRAAAGAWDGLLAPTVSRAGDESPFFGRFGAPDFGDRLAGDAGLRLLAIGSLLGLLGAYTVVVGPVLWIVLRRTRRETALWLALPALALGATVAVYGVGRSLRSSAAAAHASVVADLPAARVRWTEVLVSSPNGGRDGVRLETGWHPAPAGSINGDPNGLTGNQRVEGGSLITDIPPGGAALVAAEQTGPATSPSWSFDLKPQGNDLIGTVTNRSDQRLQRVMVTAGQGFAAVGDLDPGASAPVTLRDANRQALANDRILNELMSDVGFNGRSDGGGPDNPASLLRWLERRPALREPGVVLAVGWSRQPAAPLTTAKGSRVERGRTAFVSAVRAPLATGGSGRVEVLRGRSTQISDLPNDRAGCGGDKGTPATIRLVAPEAGAARSLAIDVSTVSVAAFDLWDGTAWRAGGMARAPANRTVGVAVPAAAVVDGGIYLRVGLGCQAFGEDDAFPALRPAVPGEKLAQAGNLAGPGTVVGPEGTARG